MRNGKNYKKGNMCHITFVIRTPLRPMVFIFKFGELLISLKSSVEGIHLMMYFKDC